MTLVPKKAFVRKENGQQSHVKTVSDQHHVIHQYASIAASGSTEQSALSVPTV